MSHSVTELSLDFYSAKSWIVFYSFLLGHRGRVPGRRLPCRGIKEGQLLCLAITPIGCLIVFAKALKSRSQCQIPPLVSRARRRRLRSLWRCAAEMRRESRAILPCPRSRHSG